MTRALRARTKDHLNRMAKKEVDKPLPDW